jgi:hypothetical protein
MAVHSDDMEASAVAVRKQTHITEAQDRSIKRLAQTKGPLEAEILRRAIDLYLDTQGVSVGEDPYRDFIGVGSSGDGDGSVKHDTIYERR